MKFDFSQIYPEIDTDFDLSGMLLELLCERLDSLQKEINHYNKKFQGDDYSIVFIISATRNKVSLETKGPRFLRKSREVEFALHIPYKEIKDFDAKVSYVLNHIAQGIIFVLKKYESDPTGIEETIQDVIKTVRNSGEKYRYPS